MTAPRLARGVKPAVPDSAGRDPGDRTLDLTLRDRLSPRARRTLPPFCIAVGPTSLRTSATQIWLIWIGVLRPGLPCGGRSFIDLTPRRWLPDQSRQRPRRAV